MLRIFRKEVATQFATTVRNEIFRPRHLPKCKSRQSAQHAAVIPDVLSVCLSVKFSFCISLSQPAVSLAICLSLCCCHMKIVFHNFKNFLTFLILFCIYFFFTFSFFVAFADDAFFYFCHAHTRLQHYVQQHATPCHIMFGMVPRAYHILF